MSNTYNGVNAVTTAMGDTGASFDVTLENQSSFTKVEPLTNLQLPAGQTVLVNVTGDLAHAQLVKNIQQINAMAGFEVIGVSSVAADGAETGGDEQIFPFVGQVNAIIEPNSVSYTGGNLAAAGTESMQGYAVSIPLNSESFKLKLPQFPLLENQQVRLLIMLRATNDISTAIWDDNQAYLQLNAYPTGDVLVNNLNGGALFMPQESTIILKRIDQNLVMDWDGTSYYARLTSTNEAEISNSAFLYLIVEGFENSPAPGFTYEYIQSQEQD